MTHARWERYLCGGGAAAYLFYLTIQVACESQPRSEPRFIPPDTIGWVSLLGIVLFAAGLILAAVRQRSWRRLPPLLLLVTAVPVAVIFLGLFSLFTQRLELDRATLHDGRLIMLARQPGPSDTVYELWEREGWRWKSLLDPVSEITYSEDGDFTADPSLVVSRDGRYLMIRRGGIWTDCWVVPDALKRCVSSHPLYPDARSVWLDHSDRITERVGRAPTDG